MTEYTTGYFNLNSSFVNDVYHDENTNKVHVVLNDADVYTYENVTPEAVKSLVNADSVGGYYNTVFKPTFGPSTVSDTWYPQDFDRVVKNNNVVQGDFLAKSEPTKEYSLYSTPVFDQTVSGAPLVSDATPEYSLAEIPAEKPSLRVVEGEGIGPDVLEIDTLVITYLYNGKKSKFEAKEAGDIDEALQEFGEVLERLGISLADVKPTKVVCKFE